MRRFTRIVIGGIVVLTIGSSPSWAGGVHVLRGTRNIDNDFSPIDKHDVFGAMLYLEITDWPFLIATGVSVSDDEGDLLDPLSGMTLDVEVTFTEIYFGVAKVWEKSQRMRPYVGGGLNLQKLEVEASVAGMSIKDDDRSLGPYVNGGVYWVFGESFSLGLDAKFVVSSVTSILDETINSGYTQFGGTVGWNW